MSTNPPARFALIQGASRGIGLALAEEFLARAPENHVIATCRAPEQARALRLLAETEPQRLHVLRLDVCDESSIEKAAVEVGQQTDRLHLLVNAAGLLHDGPDHQPEKRLESIDPQQLHRAFEVNAFGPLLVAKHFFPWLRHDERSVLANLSARVGSIGDDRAGGWYGYRASKAAQNMFTRNIAIELGRRAPNCICVALHPGTVATELSRPFRRGVPAEKLFEPERAARQLLDVIEGLSRDDSGEFFAWDGSPVPW